MVRRKPAGQYQPGVADGRLDLQRATERACGVVGLRTVVIREDMVVTAIAKNRTAAFSDIRRRLHPTRRLRIEIAQGLQLSILRFREDLNPHGGRHIRRGVLWLVLLSCLQRFPGRNTHCGGLWGLPLNSRRTRTRPSSCRDQRRQVRHPSVPSHGVTTVFQDWLPALPELPSIEDLDDGSCFSRNELSMF